MFEKLNRNCLAFLVYFKNKTMNSNLIFDTSNDLSVFSFHYGKTSKFDSIYNLIMEHATGLFTPKKLLSFILKNISNSSVLRFTLKDLLKFSDEKSNNLFIEAIKSNKISENFIMFILIIEPFKHIDKIKSNHRIFIESYFKNNPNVPAAMFNDFNSTLNQGKPTEISILVINEAVIGRYDLNKLELHIDHELNHFFEKFLNDKISSVAVENQLQEKVINWFIENNIKYNDFSNLVELNDFTIHMFDTSEFFEMCANVCNWLSLYKKDDDKLSIFNSFLKMTTDNFIKSEKFKKLEEPIAGAIVFAFICRKFIPKRWNIVQQLVKEQLCLDKTKHLSLKLFLNKITNFFKRF